MPGDPERVVYEDAPLPPPDEVLLREYAAGIMPTELTWSETYQTPGGHERLPTIPGHDVSGVVEALGAGASEVSPAMASMAWSHSRATGAPRSTWPCGPRTWHPGHGLSTMSAPPRSLPLSALTAWQAILIDSGLAAGQRVLTHGAAGGMWSTTRLHFSSLLSSGNSLRAPDLT